MHMTCRKCTHEFCWLCRGDWRGHNACNKSQEVIDEEAKQSSAKNELEHYMFYWHRYDSHKKAMKIAQQQAKDSEARGEEMMNKFGVRSQDVKFLSEASNQLVYNRNMLQNSYVYSYFLSTKHVRISEKNLFEYLQQNLESNTDTLSELYETDIESQEYNNFIKWREQVTNFTRVSKKFFDNFVDGIIRKSLTVMDGEHLSDDERFYFDKIEILENMGFDRTICLHLLKEYDGNVEKVVQICVDNNNQV